MRLYTREQRERRDASAWTKVQAILAPLQFVAFLISLLLVLRFLISGTDLTAAIVSVLIKTLFLYSIMITGALWERAVFGRYLFAPAFFWEDVLSMFVIAIHSVYLYALMAGAWTPRIQLYIALTGYGAYLVNAGQFLLKLRLARQERPDDCDSACVPQLPYPVGHPS